MTLRVFLIVEKIKLVEEKMEKLLFFINQERNIDVYKRQPYISEIRKEFYKTMIDRRYKEILLPAYEKII